MGHCRGPGQQAKLDACKRHSEGHKRRLEGVKRGCQHSGRCLQLLRVLAAAAAVASFCWLGLRSRRLCLMLFGCCGCFVSLILLICIASFVAMIIGSVYGHCCGKVPRVRHRTSRSFLDLEPLFLNEWLNVSLLCHTRDSPSRSPRTRSCLRPTALIQSHPAAVLDYPNIVLRSVGKRWIGYFSVVFLRMNLSVYACVHVKPHTKSTYSLCVIDDGFMLLP